MDVPSKLNYMHAVATSYKRGHILSKEIQRFLSKLHKFCMNLIKALELAWMFWIQTLGMRWPYSYYDSVHAYHSALISQCIFKINACVASDSTLIFPECTCDPTGTVVGSTCNPIGGQCNCETGVMLLDCSICQVDYYGFNTDNGCRRECPTIDSPLPILEGFIQDTFMKFILHFSSLQLPWNWFCADFLQWHRTLRMSPKCHRKQVRLLPPRVLWPFNRLFIIHLPLLVELCMNFPCVPVLVHLLHTQLQVQTNSSSVTKWMIWKHLGILAPEHYWHTFIMDTFFQTYSKTLLSGWFMLASGMTIFLNYNMSYSM